MRLDEARTELKRILLAAALLAIAPRAHAEGIRVGNWPTSTAITGAVAVTNLPTAGAYMSTSVAISSTSVTVASSNPNRKGLLIYNNSASIVYIAYDSIASTTHLTFAIAASSTWTMPGPVYLGAVAAVRGSTGDGKLLITELM